MAKKIKKIKIPTADVPAGETLEVYDIDAVHSVKTYNGGKELVGSGDVSLADTPITNSEVDALFA